MTITITDTAGKLLYATQWRGSEAWRQRLAQTRAVNAARRMLAAQGAVKTHLRRTLDKRDVIGLDADGSVINGSPYQLWINRGLNNDH